MDEILFTPVAVLDTLRQIEELKGQKIELTESGNSIQLQIGESLYNIDTNRASDVEVTEDAIEDVQDINESEYDGIVDTAYSADMVNDVIESGIIKEVAKTLLVGGLVRLTSKVLKR